MPDYLEQVRQLMNGRNAFIALVIYIVSVVALWKVFNKAGEPGWTAFIPIVNLYKTCKIADGNGWKFLLYIIPVVNIIYYVLVNIRFAKAFGKSTAFGIGLIFFNVLFVYILAFGSARYVGPARRR
ncbi:MAG: hypothetical protein II135_01165 [Clostridia bacterium]|nr:hypothetical protein [Clostridia bacterium]